ncbi:unnamed protein product [Paramecium sonneborni]|uniref:Uncharacterized protein n=1 Tax=Paramecium sonneborni TaxID=65129 RepID=A0A8S1R4T4_9CILI|nr:unnamed protein product [Paramecium sonneborni]
MKKNLNLKNLFIDDKIAELQNQGQLEYQGVVFDCRQFKFENIKFNLRFTQEGEIIYTNYLGSILRIDQFQNQDEELDIMFNLDQIQYLQWQGKYGQNFQKFGRWIAFWKGHALPKASGYYLADGKKSNTWSEMTKNYCDQSQIYEVGEYFNNQRIGIWKYVCENQEIDGGSYNEIGLKNGKWVDLSENFNSYSQLTQQGEYKNGIRVGIWDTYWKQVRDNDKLIQIAGGYYNLLGLKNGQWVELNDDFRDNSQVIFIGKYNQGQKVGKWDIIYEGKCIGGGSYDNQYLKHGQWKELSDNFYNDSQVIYEGEYKNGIKLVDGMFIGNNQKAIISLIQWGSYNNLGLKFNKWIELFENFSSASQLILTGEYKNGLKVGRWVVSLKDGKYFEQIGGGCYEEEDGTQNGKWIEIDRNFALWSQIIYQGTYEKGRKVGKWNVYWRKEGKEFNDSFNSIQKQLQYLFFLVGEVIIIYKTQKMGNGGSRVVIFTLTVKLFMKVNIIMVKKLAIGTFYLDQMMNLLNQLAAVNIICQTKNMGNGKIQKIISILIVKLLIMENMIMVKKQVNGIFIGELTETSNNFSALVVAFMIDQAFKMVNGLNWTIITISIIKLFMKEIIKMVSKQGYGLQNIWANKLVEDLIIIKTRNMGHGSN